MDLDSSPKGISALASTSKVTGTSLTCWKVALRTWNMSDNVEQKVIVKKVIGPAADTVTDRSTLLRLPFLSQRLMENHDGLEVFPIL